MKLAILRLYILGSEGFKVHTMLLRSWQVLIRWEITTIFEVFVQRQIIVCNPVIIHYLARLNFTEGAKVMISEQKSFDSVFLVAAKSSLRVPLIFSLLQKC